MELGRARVGAGVAVRATSLVLYDPDIVPGATLRQSFVADGRRIVARGHRMRRQPRAPADARVGQRTTNGQGSNRQDGPRAAASLGLRRFNVPASPVHRIPQMALTVLTLSLSGLAPIVRCSELTRFSFPLPAVPPPASPDAPAPPPRLTLNQFLSAVAASNLDFAAQRFGVSIARAQLAAASVSPNPVVNLGFTHDLTRERQAEVLAGGISQEIELAGRRSFRVSVAQANVLAASAALEDYFRTLRGTAASAYVDAVAGRLIVEQKRRAASVLGQLAETTEFRRSVGDVAEVDVNQARLDAVAAQGDLFSSQSTARQNVLALLQLLGRPGAPLPETVGRLEFPDRRYDLAALLAKARTSRPDVVAARHAVDSARAAVRLARANRVSDPTLGVTVQQASRIRNSIDPAPNFNALVTTLSFPLPLFNSYRGEFLSATQTALQSERTLQSVELKAETEVRAAHARLELAHQRVAKYQGSALDLAGKVLDAKVAAYRQGGASLLDVLAARRADTDVRLAAVDALTERAKAWIALQQAANVWELGPAEPAPVAK